MAVKVCALLAVLACLTVRQSAIWASDLTLWGAAVHVNVTSPRPAYNYALALRIAGRPEEAVEWLITARDRAVGHPREANYRSAVQLQFAALEATGVYVCDSERVQPYCY